MGRFINPFTDYGFKKIFGQKLSKDLLKERTLSYLSYAVARQGQAGDHRLFDIKVYGVFFMLFLIKENVKFRTDIILADRDTGEHSNVCLK